jgi:hypothetical protein
MDWLLIDGWMRVCVFVIDFGIWHGTSPASRYRGLGIERAFVYCVLGIQCILDTSRWLVFRREYTQFINVEIQ